MLIFNSTWQRMLGKSLGSLFLSNINTLYTCKCVYIYMGVCEYIRISIEYKSNLLINEWVIILRSCIFFFKVFFRKKIVPYMNTKVTLVGMNGMSHRIVGTASSCLTASRNNYQVSTMFIFRWNLLCFSKIDTLGSLKKKNYFVFSQFLICIDFWFLISERERDTAR